MTCRARLCIESQLGGGEYLRDFAGAAAATSLTWALPATATGSCDSVAGCTSSVGAASSSSVSWLMASTTPGFACNPSAAEIARTSAQTVPWA